MSKSVCKSAIKCRDAATDGIMCQVGVSTVTSKLHVTQMVFITCFSAASGEVTHYFCLNLLPSLLQDMNGERCGRGHQVEI